MASKISIDQDILYNLSADQILKFKNNFERTAKKSPDPNSNTISPQNLEKFFVECSFTLSETQIQQIIHNAPIGNQPGFTFHYLIQVLNRKMLDEELELELRELFRRFDSDGTGLLTASKIKQGLLRIKEKMSNEEIDRLIEENDRNGDGCLDLDEFIIMMMRRP